MDYRGHRYRLIGYDTPETSNVRWRKVTAEEKAFGAISRDRLKELLQSGSIDLIEQLCACSRKAEAAGTCNHRRKCAVLSKDGKNIGETLIAEELAVAFKCTERRCQKMPDWDAILRRSIND